MPSLGTSLWLLHNIDQVRKYFLLVGYQSRNSMQNLCTQKSSIYPSSNLDWYLQGFVLTLIRTFRILVYQGQTELLCSHCHHIQSHFHKSPRMADLKLLEY